MTVMSPETDIKLYHAIFFMASAVNIHENTLIVVIQIPGTSG
jgi:hypothetical protein